MPSPSRPIERLKPLLGTFVRIRVEGLAKPQAHAAIGEAFDCIASIQRLMSFHEPDSDLSRLNRDACRSPVKVHAHTRTVLGKALEIARASDGLFDPAIARHLVRKGLLPPPAASEPAGGTWRDVSITEAGAVSFARPLWLDLGGIAKGYAVDCAIAVIAGHGPKQISVEAGGDLRICGAKPERVYLDAPAPGGDLAVLEIENAAVASSGSQDVPGLGHVSPHIDTRNGQACPAGRFVSVVAPNCVDADALTKIVMATGDTAHPLLARHGARAFLFEDARWRGFAEAA